MHLEHDPKTKQQVKDMLYDMLYSPVKDRLAKRLKAIILENCKLQNITHPSFTYRGDIYVSEDCIAAPPRKPTQLSDTLKSNMDGYLKEVDLLNDYELPHVLGYINQVVDSSDHIADYLGLLPDVMHRPILQLIATCPCRHARLDSELNTMVKQQNAASMNLIKERLDRNLLL